MFIMLVNGNVTVVDSVEVHEDSTAKDSAMVYEIPEIIDFGSDSKIDRNLHSIQNIIPLDYDLNLTDAFIHTPLISISYGDGQLNLISKRGQYPGHTTLFLNNHRINNPLYGYIDLTKIPVQFIESITVGQNYPGIQGLNVTSKVNHYDRPFSYIKYSTGDFGTNLYNADLTRPITNDLGFYLSGLYWSSHGHSLNDQFEITSFYSNLYYNQIIPMRLDILYFANDHGIPSNTLDTLNASAEDRFLDACLACGNSNHKIALYHTVNNSLYSDATAGVSYTNNVKNYGIENANYHNVKGYEINYRFIGQLSQIESDLYGSHSTHSLILWAALKKSFSRFLLSLSNQGELSNDNTFFYAPEISAGFNLFDSTYLFSTLSRYYRIPSLSETFFPSVMPYSYYYIRGNEDLVPEYYWLQEIGIKRKNCTLTFYKYDYDNLIILQSDNGSYYTPHNIASWQTIGVESHCVARIRLSNHSDTTSITEIAAGYSGNYLFKGDSLPFIPKGNSSIFISFKRKTERFALDLILQEQFVDIRQDIYGQEIPLFRILSAVGTVRFLTLFFILRFDNILDENYAYIPDYTMAPRHLNFTVKWEFWD